MSEITEKLTRSYLHIPKKKPLSGKTLGQLFNEKVAVNPDKEMYVFYSDKERKTYREMQNEVRMYIGQLFNEKVAENPDKEMYVFYSDKERKTYREMQNESHQFAASLLKLGVKKGDFLGVWGGNHYEWLLAYLAAFQIGIITVHMRIDFPLRYQQEIVKKIGIKVIVLMRSPSDMCDQASQLIPELVTNPAEDLRCNQTPSIKYVINAGTDNSLKGAFALKDFMNIGNTVDKSEVLKAIDDVDYDDPLGLFFTSGSTGFPKAVTHTHKTLSVMPDLFDMYSIDRDGTRIPWTKRFALIMSFGGAGAQGGALLPLVEDSTTIIVGPKYDSLLLAKVFHEEKATGAFMLIHHLNDIINLPDFDQYDFSSFQLCLAGGSIIPRSLRDRAANFTKHMLLSYGGTEGFSASQTPKFPDELLEEAVYFPMDGQEVKIVGPDDKILPINTPGELCYRSLYLFSHYWGDEEKTRATKRPTGWYYTGDLGTLDERGYLRILGRKAERIIKEGINIAPGELEKVLDQHPAVNNVMVVGVPDERTSEEVCACVRLHPSSSATADELKEFCKGKVSDFLVPKYVLLMEDTFPTTETGKFARNKLAEQAKNLLGL